jgi:hypothetical protein
MEGVEPTPLRAQIGRLEQAKESRHKAFALGDANKLKLAALDDPDLRPLWVG